MTPLSESHLTVFRTTGIGCRGLLNTGNACFRNVILQALLACEPFFR